MEKLSLVSVTLLFCAVLHIKNLTLARPTPPINWGSQWRLLGKCLGMSKKHRPKSILINIRTTKGIMLVVPTNNHSNSNRTSTRAQRVPDRISQTGRCNFSWELNYNRKRFPKFLPVATCRGKQCKTCNAIFYTHYVLIMKPNCPGIWEWREERHAVAYVQRSV